MLRTHLAEKSLKKCLMEKTSLCLNPKKDQCVFPIQDER